MGMRKNHHHKITWMPRFKDQEHQVEINRLETKRKWSKLIFSPKRVKRENLSHYQANIGISFHYVPNRNWVLNKFHARCECQASKHALVRNCLECGRIICAQEGPGPCLFCFENVGEKYCISYSVNLSCMLRVVMELKLKKLLVRGISNQEKDFWMMLSFRIKR